MAEKKKHEIPAAWRELYEKGLAAMQSQNLDYALTLFCKVLEKEPGFFDCREALRVAQHKKAGAGTGFFKRAFGKATSTGPLLAKAQYSLRSNPLEAINILEQALNNDAQSVMAHKHLAEAALAAGLPKTAVLSLEIAIKQSPKDRLLSIRLAEALTAAGQIARAEKIYSELLRANPSDHEIAQAVKDLSARRTMSEGGYDALEGGQGSYRDILKNEQEAVALEQAQREVKTEDVAGNLIREYESQLKQEPGNVKLLRTLGDLYDQKNDSDRALDYYHRALAAGQGADPGVEKTIGEVRLKKIKRAMAALDPAAPDYQDQLSRLEAEHREFRIAECKQRVDKYPTDLLLRFEMGQVYLEAGKLNEAIQEFQKAQANPHKRVASMYCLGQCFAQRKMLDLAARTFQNAIKEKEGFDDEKKEIIYALGCVLEQMKKTDLAIEQFKLIYEIDIGYQDVAAKVDAYYSTQG